MSIQAINWALEQPGTPTQKHVLLVLANYANESGIAFPSVATLALDTGLSERAIKKARGDLSQAGLISRSPKYGRSGFTLCLGEKKIESAPRALKGAPDARKEEPDAPLNESARGAPKSASPAPESAPGAPPYNHHITTNNHHTPYSPPAAKKSKSEKFTLPDWIPAEAWAGWLEMRRAKKCPTTSRAMNKAIKDLQALKAKGQDPGEVLDNCTLNGWRGIFPIKNTPSQRPLTPAEQGRQTSLDRLEALYVH